MILDPYEAEAYEKSLTPGPLGIVDADDAALTMVGVVLMSVCFSIIMGGVGAGIGAIFHRGHETFIDVLLAAALFFLILTIGTFSIECGASRRIKKARQNRPEIVTTPSTETAMKTIAENLRSLTVETRMELKPLWQACLDANALMVEGGYDGHAFQRIREREAVVRDYVQTQMSMEAEVAKIDADNRRRVAQDRYGSNDDSDLVVARLQREALEAGRQRYRELNSAHTNLA